jgi:tRNA(Ile)-lysidine synthase
MIAVMCAVLALDRTLLRPGLRLAVGVSGGADSVALLRALVEESRELGLVVHAAHLHHGLRGEEAEADQDFVCDLCAQLRVPCHLHRVDTAAEARSTTGKQGETLEEAARRLRYAWFRALMAGGKVDAIVTAHTLDDQAETVLAKFLRGAWTEGLSGIHPLIEFDEGPVVRPMLGTTRSEVEAYLRAIGQSWREDSTNRQLTFTRNRIRHELLPMLEEWNPRLRAHLAQMAELARDEETWWRAEMSQQFQHLILRGRPVRGGGRAGDQGIALDVTRLAALPVALQRRLLRFACGEVGAAPDFGTTETLRQLTLRGKAGQRLDLSGGLRAERTPRELRLAKGGAKRGKTAVREYRFAVPGAVEAKEFGIRLRVEGSESEGAVLDQMRTACLRTWKAGDSVRLRYSSGPKKVKEVLERMRVTGTGREVWPVLEVAGRIVWMQGAEVEPLPGMRVIVDEAEN